MPSGMQALAESTVECRELIRQLDVEQEEFKELSCRLWQAIEDLPGRLVHDSEQRARIEQALRGELGDRPGHIEPLWQLGGGTDLA